MDESEPTPSPSGGGAHAISPLALALSAVCIVAPLAISWLQKLELHAQLTVAAIRMTLQLFALGLVLVPIFTYDRWWLVLIYACFMGTMASAEAAQRPSHTYTGMFVHILGALSLSAGALITYTALVVLRPTPRFGAQYIIPILGMLLGNATSGVSVALTAVLEEFSSRRDSVELLLALGATRSEATGALVRRAIKLALQPLVNQMAVMGIVSIPGMMTGQILSGQDPTQAAMYQIMIMFVVGGTTAIATTAAVFAAVHQLVDERTAVRPDRLRPRHTAAEMAADALLVVRKVLGRIRSLCITCFCCVMPGTSSLRRRTGPGSGGGSGAGAALLREHRAAYTSAANQGWHTWDAADMQASLFIAPEVDGGEREPLLFAPDGPIPDSSTWQPPATGSQVSGPQLLGEASQGMQWIHTPGQQIARSPATPTSGQVLGAHSSTSGSPAPMGLAAEASGHSGQGPHGPTSSTLASWAHSAGMLVGHYGTAGVGVLTRAASSAWSAAGRRSSGGPVASAAVPVAACSSTSFGGAAGSGMYARHSLAQSEAAPFLDAVSDSSSLGASAQLAASPHEHSAVAQGSPYAGR